MPVILGIQEGKVPTFDDLASANGGLEVSAAYRRVESESNTSSELLMPEERQYCTHCLPFLFGAFESKRLPVYSMVIVSPFFAFVVPSPGLICSFVTPMMSVDRGLDEL